MPVRETAHDACSAANFSIQALKRVVCSDMPPVRYRKRVIRKCLITARFHDFGCFLQTKLSKLFHNLCRFLAGGFLVFLRMNGFEHQGDIFGFASWDGVEHITVKVHHATLPLRLWVKFAQRFQKAKAFV